jgi:hypothetical protein
MPTLTFVHVVLSLIGIFAGFFVVLGLLSSKRLDGSTAGRRFFWRARWRRA